MSTHSFHWHAGAEITSRWSNGGDCAVIEVGGCDINIHAHGIGNIERLRMAISAFERELEREPVAQAEAAE